MFSKVLTPKYFCFIWSVCSVEGLMEMNNVTVSVEKSALSFQGSWDSLKGQVQFFHKSSPKCFYTHPTISTYLPAQRYTAPNRVILSIDCGAKFCLQAVICKIHLPGGRVTPIRPVQANGKGNAASWRSSREICKKRYLRDSLENIDPSWKKLHGGVEARKRSTTAAKGFFFPGTPART